MIRLLRQPAAAGICCAGIVSGFGAGWFLRPASPAANDQSAVHFQSSIGERSGRPLETASEAAAAMIARLNAAKSVAEVMRCVLPRQQEEAGSFARCSADLPLLLALCRAGELGGGEALAAALETRGTGERARSNSGVGSLQSIAAQAWATRWSADDPAATVRWADSLRPAARAGVLAGICEGVKGTTPEAALGAFELANLLPDAATIAAFMTRSPEATVAWLEQQAGVSSELFAHAAMAWAQREPESAAAWAAGLPDPVARLRATVATVECWLRDEPSDALDWLGDQL